MILQEHAKINVRNMCAVLFSNNPVGKAWVWIKLPAFCLFVLFFLSCGSPGDRQTGKGILVWMWERNDRDFMVHEEGLPAEDSPLFLAIYSFDEDALQQAVEDGYHVNDVNSRGEISLYCAYQKKSQDMFMDLLKYGANPFQKDFISFLVREEALDYLGRLRKAGVSLDRWDSNGQTPLIVSIEEGSLFTFTFLLQQGVSSKRSDKDDRTPLDYVDDRKNLAGLPDPDFTYDTMEEILEDILDE